MKPFAYYNEWDKYAAHRLRQNIAQGLIMPGYVDERSIKEVSPDDLEGFTQVHFFAGLGLWSAAARRAGWPDARPLWSGSCPCQPYSAAGKRGGVDDPRHLWPDMFRLASARRPAEIVGEQVAASLGYGWFDGVRSDLASENYACRGIDIPACSVNAPHIRNRLYWIAKRMADANAGERDGRPEFEERGSKGRGASERFDASSQLGDTNSDGRRRPGLSARRSNGKGGANTSGADGRDAGTAGNARTLGAMADRHEPELERDERSGKFAELQHHAGNHGAGVDLVDASIERRGQGRAAPEILRWWDTVAGADVRLGTVAQGDGQSGIGGAGLRSGGTGEVAFASNPDGEYGVTLGDAVGSGLEGLGRHGDGRTGRPEQDRPIASPDGRNGTFWSDAEWILCHDGKARRTERGLRLLVDGYSNRISDWRAAGNAVCLELATEVIAAYLESENKDSRPS